MNSVDRVDQGCNEYRTDEFRHRSKYWWSMFDRLLNVSMSNAYVLYCGRVAQHNRWIKAHRIIKARQCAAEAPAATAPPATAPQDFGLDYVAQQNHDEHQPPWSTSTSF